MTPAEKILKEIVGNLLRRAVDEALSKPRDLAADLNRVPPSLSAMVIAIDFLHCCDAGITPYHHVVEGKGMGRLQRVARS